MINENPFQTNMAKKQKHVLLFVGVTHAESIHLITSRIKRAEYPWRQDL